MNKQNDIFKKIIDNLTEQEKENIKDILTNIDDEKQKKEICNCIDNCTSPKEQTVKINDKEKKLSKVQTIFYAFNLFPFNETRILIIGKDPYPDEKYPNKADGLAFSQNGKEKAVDSLKNIFIALKKYHNDFNKDNACTDLKTWANKNRVLLLNTALTFDKTSYTVRKNAWKPFVKITIQKLLISNNEKLVIFLWGNKAEELFNECLKNTKIKRNILVLKSNHPSPLSVNNGGNFLILAPVHFAACDEFLGKNAKGKYTWKDFPEE